MDVLEQALDQGAQDKDKDLGEEVAVPVNLAEVDGADGSGEGFSENIQYQFRTDGNGQSQVTYRVVQVGDGDGTPQTVITNFPQGQQALTQVIQGSFNGDSPTNEGQGGETRFTYFPASATITSDAGTGSGSGGEAANIAQTAAPTGSQFYVMMSPQDVLQNSGQRTIAPRTHSYTGKVDTSRGMRDERRRATHNEVERRRRDKINNWIVRLSKLIPDCNQDNSKAGQSKGGILSKTCDYIQDLRSSNAQMAENLKDMERMSVDLEIMRQKIDELKNENTLLRAALQQHEIDMPGQPN